MGKGALNGGGPEHPMTTEVEVSPVFKPQHEALAAWPHLVDVPGAGEDTELVGPQPRSDQLLWTSQGGITTNREWSQIWSVAQPSL